MDKQFNRKRPRRYNARPGVSPGPDTSESSDMDPTTDSAGSLSPEIVQEIAEAKLAESERNAASAGARDSQEYEETDNGSGSEPGGDDSGPEQEGGDSSPQNRQPQPGQQPNPQQGQNPGQGGQGQRPPRDPQQQQILAQQRREQEMQRRQAEQQRREQDRLRREQEQQRRQAEQQRREQEERGRIPVDELCTKAWDIYLAEVSEEGVELFPDNDARELARRSFRLAEIFLQEEMRARRMVGPPPQQQPRGERERWQPGQNNPNVPNGGGGAAQEADNAAVEVARGEMQGTGAFAGPERERDREVAPASPAQIPAAGEAESADRPQRSQPEESAENQERSSRED